MFRLNLTERPQCSVVMNVVNLMAYIVSNGAVYEEAAALSLTVGSLMLDFENPVLPYNLKVASSYSNEHRDRLMSSLERALSAFTRFRPDRGEAGVCVVNEHGHQHVF